MSRNGSGTYTLPAGNPVSSGTLIDAAWANSTLSDIATALTDSLSRSGSGGMTAPLRFTDGSVSAPGIAWTNETSSGFYRAAASDFRVALNGVDVATVTSTGLTVVAGKTLAAQGNATVAGTLGVTGVLTATGGVSGNVTGNVTGNASTATTLQTARNINGVSFNGSANISVNTVNSVTFNNGGAGAASGTTFDGGAAVTVSYNTVGAPSTTGTNATGSWGISVTGNAGTVTDGVYTTGAQTIAGIKTFTDSVRLLDNDILALGTSQDWEMYHNGTNNIVDLTVGDLLIRDDADASDTTRFTFGRTTGNLTATGNVTATGGTVTIGASALAPSGSAPSYTARAWVNFNGTGTVAIRASGNVTSITDNGVGEYTVNFATAMADANYAAVGNGRRASLAAPGLLVPTVYTNTNIRLITFDSTFAASDSDFVSVTIFR